MKFLSKNALSTILQNNLRYEKNKDNSVLKKLLMTEQKNFCAYTEKYLQPLDSVEVEHFDSSKKFADDYYNYYAVIRNANLFKQDEKYAGASFFENLFFQKIEELTKRISFAKNTFYEIDETDIEARDFIDFIGLNHPKLSEQREKHLNRMRDYFKDYTSKQRIEHFKKYKEELNFVTAMEVEFGDDYSEIINAER